MGDSRVIRGSRWLTAGVVLVMGLIATIVMARPLQSAEPSGWWMLGVLIAVGIAAWWSPLRPGRHQPINEVAVGAPEIAVLWRPGCVYSAQLYRDLQRAHKHVAWINVWRDAEAAAVCRRLNAGQEQVPTVVVIDRTKNRPTVIPATVDGVRQALSEIGHVRGSAASAKPRPPGVAA